MITVTVLAWHTVHTQLMQHQCFLLSGCLFLLFFLVQIIKTNCIFLEEELVSVCLFMVERPLVTVSLSAVASSQKPVLPAPLFWTPITSGCYRLGIQGYKDTRLRFSGKQYLMWPLESDYA